MSQLPDAPALTAPDGRRLFAATLKGQLAGIRNLPARGPVLLPWLFPAALFGLWCLASGHGWMSRQILPPPALVWDTFKDLAQGDLWKNLGISLGRLALGVLGGVLAGGLLGVLLGASRRAERLLYPTFASLSQVPTLAWIPLFMVFFGIGEGLKQAVLIKAVVVPVCVHTLVGVRDAQPRLQEAAAVLRLSPWLRFWRLTLPSALPAFMAGLRIALSTAWTSLLAVELLASSEGIGYLMVWGRQLFMLDVVFVCILLIGLIGLAMDKGIAALDRRLVHWPHPATAEFRHPPAQGLWQRLEPWLLPLALLALWQLACSRAWVDPNILVAPLTVVQTTTKGLLDGSLPVSMAWSLARALAGLLLGGSLGLAAGLLLGLWRPAQRLLGPSLGALRQVAIFAWVPLLTAWFGTGEAAKVVFVALATFFPLYIATLRGIAHLSPQLDEAARVLRLNRRLRLTRLILPGAAPAIFAGLRLALIFAWLGTIGAEYFVPEGDGIGSLMIAAQQLFEMDRIMAGMLLVGLTGALLNRLGQLLENRATRWRTA